MKPWNPYAMTFHGQPITGQTPPKLVVYGPPLTAQQGAMLQTAYNAFVGAARVSIVPNPTRQGRLLDGSPYTIECSQGVCTCTVWTAESNKDDDRRSGIVISLCALNGSLIAGHSENGSPTQYLLTPKVRNLSRIPTGKWTYRKLKPPDGGGKAVNAGKSGRTYFTGVNAQTDASFPFLPNAYGSINERAYIAERYDDLSVYRRGGNVGSSYANDSPLPFVFTDDDGTVKSAQIVIRRDGSVSPAEYHADLYMGDIDLAPGDYVTTLAFPPGLAVRPFTFSYRPDGRKARFIAGKDGRLHKCTLHISATELTYTSDWISGPPGSTQVWNFDAPNDTNNNSMQWRDGQYVSAPNTYPLGIFVSESANDVGTGTFTSSSNAAWAAYAYGPRGQEYDSDSASSASQTRTDNSYHSITYHEISRVGPSYTGTRTEQSNVSQTISYSSGSTVDKNFLFLLGDVAKESTTRIYEENVNCSYTITHIESPSGNSNTVNINSAGGSGFKITPNGYGDKVTPLFFDRYMQFAIGIVYGGGVRTEEFEHHFSVVPAVPLYNPGDTMLHHEIVWTKDETTPLKNELVIADRRKILLRREFDVTQRRHLIYAASDPMTGAIAVNIVEVDAGNRNNRHASWIYLVTDSTTLELHSVIPNLPANTRAVSNASLYTL